MPFRWVLLADDGAEMRSTESFDSRDEAEAWMGTEWSALREEGALSVSLRDEDAEIYEMSLLEA